MLKKTVIMLLTGFVAISAYGAAFDDHFTGTSLNTDIWDTHVTGPGIVTVADSFVKLDVTEATEFSHARILSRADKGYEWDEVVATIWWKIPTGDVADRGRKVGLSAAFADDTGDAIVVLSEWQYYKVRIYKGGVLVAGETHFTPVNSARTDGVATWAWEIDYKAGEHVYINGYEDRDPDGSPDVTYTNTTVAEIPTVDLSVLLSTYSSSTRSGWIDRVVIPVKGTVVMIR